jgi:2,3-dimethylmalate lyase
MSRANHLRRVLRARLSAVQRLGSPSGAPALVAPGIYDGFGARMVMQAGFEAAYMTGNGVSASLLGTPDVGLIDLSLMASHARHVAACIDIPLICDADTGYGGVVGVRRTVQEFEAAGVAAIHIEDQISPKRCAQFPGARTVLAFDEAVSKIAAAVAARDDPNFLIIARTDSAGAMGLDEAIRRAQAFAKVGAGAVFVELKAHAGVLADLQRIGREVPVPCIANIDAGGAQSPVAALHAGDLHKYGVSLAIYPALVRNTVGFAMRQALFGLKSDGNTAASQDRMLTGAQYNAALGLEEVEAWERAWERALVRASVQE